MTDHRRRLGARGERMAAAWYRQRGFVVVDQNFRTRWGEIDLIVSDGDLLVFCEVKTRSSSRFGSPLEAVTEAKAARIRRLGAHWLEQHPDYRRHRIRFDVAAVRPGSCDIVAGAF